MPATNKTTDPKKSRRKKKQAPTRKKKLSSLRVSKKAQRETESALVQEQIATAVEHIPERVMRDTQPSIPPPIPMPPSPRRQPPWQRPPEPPKKARTLLWTGVGMITLVIFTMWIANVFALIGDTKQLRARESNIINTAKDDLGKMIKKITEDDRSTFSDVQTQTKQEQVKTILEAIVRDAIMTTTTASSTKENTELTSAETTTRTSTDLSHTALE